jgi:hypothetical protein
MLTVTNGFKLYTAAPSSHEYHFQSAPTAIVRNVTAPFNPGDLPPFMLNDMNEAIWVTDYYDRSKDPTMDDCTLTAFSFRLERDPNTVHSLTSAEVVPGSGIWYPVVDGVRKDTMRSYVPHKFCVATTGQRGHVNADGSVYYTLDQIPWVSAVYEVKPNQKSFVSNDINLLKGASDMLLLPLSISQQENLYTVSGS